MEAALVHAMDSVYAVQPVHEAQAFRIRVTRSASMRPPSLLPRGLCQ